MSEKYICYNCFRERPDLQENPKAKAPALTAALTWRRM